MVISTLLVTVAQPGPAHSSCGTYPGKGIPTVTIRGCGRSGWGHTEGLGS